MTATGSILGSPSYMSPEQARSGTISPASDVFSLGVTLYQMVVGRTPFHGKDPLTVIAALVAGEFLRPGQLDAHVGPELEAVILRCLRRQPAERYADGHAAAAALRELAATSASAIGDEGAALRTFHDDRLTFERRIGGAVADAALASARAAMRRGELTKALAQINRALAYVPGHRGAEAMLGAISSRRRWAKGAAIIATLCVAGGAVAGVRAMRWHETASVNIALPSPPAHPPAAVTLVATPEPVAAAPAAPAPEREAPRPKEHSRAKRASAQAGVAAPSPVVAAPPVAEPAEPVVPPPAPAPVAPRAAPAPTAGITLRARQSFCSPSLDGRPPALRPIYEGVAVGAHAVYCTLPGGERVLAGTYELRAGTHPDLIILPGPDGRPTLGRPQ
jgi:hypothetical protein